MSTWIVYPTEDQREPEGKVLIAIRRHIEAGRISVVEGFVHVEGPQDLSDKLANYADAIVRGLSSEVAERCHAATTLPQEAPKQPVEAKPELSEEALLLGILGLPQGPWPCKGRCGTMLDWPGVCQSCYKQLGEILPVPSDAIASVPANLRKCTFDNPDWQKFVPQASRQAGFDVAQRDVSVEVTGDSCVQMGVAILLERLKKLKNNNDARYVRPREMTTASIRQFRDKPLLCLDYVNSQIVAALAKSTTVIACGFAGTGIKERIRT